MNLLSEIILAVQWRSRCYNIVISAGNPSWSTMYIWNFFLCPEQKRYIYDDVDRQWKGHNLDGDQKMTWDEYNATTYSNLPGEGARHQYHP